MVAGALGLLLVLGEVVLMRYCQLQACCLFISLLGASSVQAFEWADLWQSTDQRLQNMVELEAFVEAEKIAESAEQQGMLKFRSGAFEEAASLYEQEDNKYNSGTSLVRAGAYEEAISAFDEVSEQDSHYDDAMYNKKIAQALAELAQQQEGESKSGEGDNEGEGEPQPSQGEGESGAENSQDSKGSTAEQPETDDQAAPAEDGGVKAGEEESSSDNAEQASANAEEPHNEQQQTMEQWLQQVPDDPAGLLRARIIREHQRNYSQSRDREQAW